MTDPIAQRPAAATDFATLAAELRAVAEREARACSMTERFQALYPSRFGETDIADQKRSIRLLGEVSQLLAAAAPNEAAVRALANGQGGAESRAP